MAIQKYTKIFTAFSFLRLQSPSIRLYKWWYPFGVWVVALIGFYGFLFCGCQFLTFDQKSIVSDMNTLMGILVGFYIAALAAVSSFPNDNLDQVMEGEVPTIATIRDGKTVSEKLTRRRFLSILFGYCAVLAVILYVLGVFIAHLEVSVPTSAQTAISVVEHLVWWVYIWIISSLLIVTLLGLHYLVERMHRP